MRDRSLLPTIIPVLLLTAAGHLVLPSRALGRMVTGLENGTVTGSAAVAVDNPASGGRTVEFVGRTYRNPVVPALPDPGVIRVDDKGGPNYYLVGTAGSIKGPEPVFGIMRSRDLVNWSFTGKHVLPAVPTWSNGNSMWAPEIHKIGSTFVAYYVAASRTGHLSVGVATADAVLGPYTDLGRPLIQDDAVGMIDPTVFTDDDGRHYLYYKSDGEAVGRHTYIYVQRLAADGLSVTGPRLPVMHGDKAWEGDAVQAPWVTKHAGRYYLFYSGDAYNTPDYAVGVARSSSPTGGFVKRPAPVLRSNASWYGPGHNSVTTGPDGVDQIVYHAYVAGPWRDVRPTLVEPVTWVDGWPSVGDGTPTIGPLPYPSGRLPQPSQRLRTPTPKPLRTWTRPEFL